MLCLGGSEIRCKGLKTNAGLTESLTTWDSETKVGLNEPWYSVNWSPSCQTSYPGGNRLVAGERSFSLLWAMAFEFPKEHKCTMRYEEPWLRVVRQY